jgi:hypothetical protein
LQLLLQGRHSIGKNVGRSLVLFAKRIPKDDAGRECIESLIWPMVQGENQTRRWGSVVA